MPVPLFNINLIAVGKIKDRLLAEKINDYYTRLAFDIRFTTHEIKDSDKDTEGKKIVDLVKDQTTFVIALSEEGHEFSSEEFSQYLLKAGRNIHFCIGGPTGLSVQIKKQAHALISLSKMTFTHEIARMLLLEQIYRAVSIIKNRGYHK
jgi:23S rRNA (pseudouridine1915-N3)-methyltransferase